MATYVPDPTDINTPLDTDNIGNVTPPEIRALKQHVIDKFAELEGLINAAASRVNGQVDSLVNSTNSSIDEFADLISAELAPHLINVHNPHGVTKAQIGLGKVANYGISDSTSLTSSTTYASAYAAKLAFDKAVSAVNTLTTAYNKITALESRANNLATYASLANKLSSRVGNLPKNWGYLERIMAGTGRATWKNTSGKDALVIEVLTSPNLTRNPIKIIANSKSYTYKSSDTLKAFCICFT